MFRQFFLKNLQAEARKIKTTLNFTSKSSSISPCVKTKWAKIRTNPSRSDLRLQLQCPAATLVFSSFAWLPVHLKTKVMAQPTSHNTWPAAPFHTGGVLKGDHILQSTPGLNKSLPALIAGGCDSHKNDKLHSPFSKDPSSLKLPCVTQQWMLWIARVMFSQFHNLRLLIYPKFYLMSSGNWAGGTKLTLLVASSRSAPGSLLIQSWVISTLG